MNLVSLFHDSMDTGLEGVERISKFPKVLQKRDWFMLFGSIFNNKKSGKEFKNESCLLFLERVSFVESGKIFSCVEQFGFF